jgi:transposase
MKWQKSFDETVVHMVNQGATTKAVALRFAVPEALARHHINLLRKAGRIALRQEHDSVEPRHVSARQAAGHLPRISGREWYWDEANRAYKARRLA